MKIEKGYIDPIETFLGLKQGCVLSPILFNLFIHGGLFWPILLLVDLAMSIIRKREQTET